MGKAVILSTKSQELIECYSAFGDTQKDSVATLSSPLEASILVSWLASDNNMTTPATHKSQQEMEFILASLRAELLQDLLISMDNKRAGINQEEPPTSTTRLKFYLLAIAGTVLAACEGFDNISSLMSVFVVPPVITLFAALAFSVFSVIVFYGFNLVQVSNNLGVKLSEAPKLLDLYLLQMNQIKCIRKKINTYKLSELSTEELAHLIKTMDMLHLRFESLRKSSEQFSAALESPKMKITKNLFIALAGLLFFGSGLVSGQSVALFMLGLVLPTVSATCWPVVLFSVVVGLAAFSLYWYVEKVGLQQLISGWFGLDEEKIETLCNSDELDKQAYKLNNLKEKIVSMAELTQQKDELKQLRKVCERHSNKATERADTASNLSSTTNIFNFYQTTSKIDGLLNPDVNANSTFRNRSA